MCLDSITKRIADPSPLIVGGWKEFKGPSDEPRFKVYGLTEETNRVPLDKWIAADSKPIGDRNVAYNSGFHIFSDEKEKPTEAKRLVFYRNVEIEGKQNGYPCVIAREMYVPSKADAWPPPR